MDNLFADVSSNNAAFSAAPYASAGHGFVAIKATEDAHYTNPDYVRWVEDAHRHGLSVFHYHFARPENLDPIGQVEHFWDTVKSYFTRPGDYLFLDVETGDPRKGQEWLSEADAHLRHISGTHPGCYTFLSYLVEGGLRVTSGRLWVAAWGSKRPGNAFWRIAGQQLFAWQETNGVVGPLPHSMAGIPGTCDISQLNPGIARNIRKQKHQIRRHL